MGPISTTVFAELTDSMAAQVAAIAEKMGTGVEAGSASLGAQNNVDRVMALSDSAQVEALLRYFRKGVEKKLTDPNAHVLFEMEVKGLSFHVSGINFYLSSNDLRAAPEFAEIHLRSTGVQLDPENVFPPEISDMGSFSVTGLDTGVFTDGDAVDITKHGPAHLKLVATSNIGATDIDATMELHKFDGTTVLKIVHIPSGTLQDVEFDVGVAEDMFVDVVGITIFGGTAGDTFKIKAPRERALSL